MKTVTLFALAGAAMCASLRGFSETETFVNGQLVAQPEVRRFSDSVASSEVISELISDEQLMEYCSISGSSTDCFSTSDPLDSAPVFIPSDGGY